MCINYRKLNKATCKDHFSLPFIHKCLKDWQRTYIFAAWMEIRDSFKSLFTQITKKRLPLHAYMTHMLYRRMPFGLCNAPTTFQRYLMAIF